MATVKAKKSTKKVNLTKAYKVFNSNWTCRDFQYEVGKTYSQSEKPVRCGGSGFHACLKVADCFSYYTFDPKNKIAEVEVWGEIATDEEDTKIAANNIRIVREISWSDMLSLANTGAGNNGHSNAGHWNAGHRNAGDRNAGDWNAGHSNAGHSNAGHSNAGHRNAGDRNAGDWNAGDWNAGYFNTIKSDKIMLFNKPCKLEIWENAYKPYFLYFDLTKWVYDFDMTEQEKIDNPKFYVAAGYLKKIDYKEAFQESWKNADKEDRAKIKDLPNFDAKVFYEISGIKL